MTVYKGAILGALFVAIVSCALAQDVKVGYDKSANFSKYKTYTWAELPTPPARPMLYATVVGWIDADLSSKGFQRVEKDGDLILEATGGIGFGITVAGGQPLTSSYNGPPPSLNATMESSCVCSSRAIRTQNRSNSPFPRHRPSTKRGGRRSRPPSLVFPGGRSNFYRARVSCKAGDMTRSAAALPLLCLPRRRERSS